MKFIPRLSTVFSMFWAYLKLFPQLIRHSWVISRLPHPIITFFGGRRLSPDSSYAQQAFLLAKKLSEHNISIVTGGGPGVMEAANCGAAAAPNGAARTMGIGVKGLNVEEPINRCANTYLSSPYFFLRKQLLINYSHAYVIFPGGFGTLDELFEVLTFMQTKKLPVMPVILVGETYWHSLNEWIEMAGSMGLVPKEHAQYVTITDDMEKAFEILTTYCASSACSEWKHTDMI